MAALVANLPATLKLLSDPTRLRLLALLAEEELAVQELGTITGLSQSRISNHLSLLKRAGLVRDRREGSWSFHSLAEAESGGLSPELRVAVLEPYRLGDQAVADRGALQAVREQRRERSRAAHDALAERWPELGQEFTTGSLRSEALAQALPRTLVVADLGCGTGYFSAWLAERVARVIAVDHSKRMLEQARRRGLGENVELRSGELDELPIDDGTVDAAFANLVWHHVPDLDAAAREAWRILRPGGSLVISDLLPHEEDWMRQRMGDVRLGLKPDQVLGALARAGFVELRSETGIDAYRVERPGGNARTLPMFLARGRRPAQDVSNTQKTATNQKRKRESR